jgi:hypothetical protein
MEGREGSDPGLKTRCDMATEKLHSGSELYLSLSVAMSDLPGPLPCASYWPKTSEGLGPE